MVFKIDYVDDAVLEWSVGAPGATATCTRVEDYAPTIYVVADAGRELEAVRPFVAGLMDVVDTAIEERRPGWRREPEPVLRVDVADIDAVTRVAGHVRDRGPPGAYKPYNVDFSREFRYCLERGVDPTPTGDLSRLRIAVPPPALANPPIGELSIDGQTVTGGPQAVLQTVADRLDRVDPDVLVLSASDVVPVLYGMADDVGLGLELGRRPGWQRLAGASTYESYGRVGHSPARYNVPGRAIVDRSNTFIYHEGGLPGLLDMVERSHKPLQEAAWASIGNLLTAIQIREARERNVLAPWNSWRHEFFKRMGQLHEADRGGYIFAPDAGFHEDVHELDFSSLYPNIIREFNISPETIRCDCHDSADVPGLGYSICEEEGYLPDVLGPLIDDRDDLKTRLASVDDPDRRRDLAGRADAIKWILVSCFGYQGFSNAKFGRIECHEAINAFAREILLDAKDRLEAGGWDLVHGIVDSLWVVPRDGAAREPLREIAADLTDDVGIRLEYEGAFEWCAFVPMADSEAGALTKYFGKRAGGGGYKYRGIEVRQRSTPPFVARVQEDLIRTLDESRSPAAVCDRLRDHLLELAAGRVDPADLAIRNRVSKRVEEYSQYTRAVAALERADDLGLDAHPGQDVSYVVVDDAKASRERVRLDHEDAEGYDAAFYRDRLIGAAESVVSPLGWRRGDIESYLAEHRDASLAAF